MAKVATTLTKEGDLFLGQKIIEVQRTGASQEVWYKLGQFLIVQQDLYLTLFLYASAEKRTEKGNDVAGHIKVNISVTIEGESLTPFHVQYIKLHEVITPVSPKINGKYFLYNYFHFHSKCSSTVM